MNPGLVVKLRPTGPWRIGSDSGARNRVDAIYHSDSLYAAVASAMARLGMLAEWLDATARAASPAVCFSSCFPFLDGVDFIVPPRTVWPPTHPGASPRVRWKSARFVPVRLLQSILAGRKLDENRWSVDALSECLVPAGRPGPFRANVRTNAAVDRLTGAAERHSIACTEFRKGAGLWAIVSFADQAARDRWQDPIKAAFRWLADSGFGGERSRGWGRSEAPEFIEGVLPEMLIGGQGPGEVPADFAGRGQGLGPSQPEPEPVLPPEQEPPAEPTPPVEEPQPEPPVQEPPTEPDQSRDREGAVAGNLSDPAAEETEPVGSPAPPQTAPEPEPDQGEASVLAASEIEPLSVVPEQVGQTSTSAAGLQAGPRPEANAEPEPIDAEPPAPASEPLSPEQAREPEPPAPEQVPDKHWLLSLFTPAASDAVDWTRGNYAVVTRGGRIESPAGSGELKKQLVMVAEGSVVCAAAPPQGAAPDVAPDGFPHPVYRAGFALAIPLPEVR